MSFNLSKEEKEALKELSNLQNIQFADARLNDITLRRGIMENIESDLVATVANKTLDDDKDLEYIDSIISGKDTSENARLIDFFAKSISVALMTGYFQSLNNDRNIDNPPEFGYSDLGLTFQTALISAMSDFISFDKAKNLLEVGLGVSLRVCDRNTYFENEYYHEDIKVLSDILTADIDDGYNKNILDAIGNNGDIRTSIDTYMEDLMAVYTIIFEDGFGTKPYAGVLKDSSGFITISDDSSVSAKKIEQGASTLQRLATRITKRMTGNITISDSRQFNYDEIFSSDTPVFFPKKILEYALGRESTLNITKNIYKQSAYAVSWEAYSQNYVFKNLKTILIRGIYCAIEKVLLSDGKIKSNFISREFTSTVTDYNKFIADVLIDASTYNKVFKYVSKLIDSLKTVCILTKYPYLANKIAGINIRVSCQVNSNAFTADSGVSTYLFKDLIAANSNEIFALPQDLTDGRTSSTNVNISVNVYEYQYDVNPMLSQAEPLFGYIIQKQNQKRNKASNWNNILIGESTAGKELYASKTSDIKLQNNFTHNIIAGSRSGKGVMTMNILASAIASKKPIFYIDRKPDMSSMLYNIVGDRQFIINGGNYVPDFDLNGVFDEVSGPAMSTWRSANSYLSSNPRIMELFGVANTSYQGVLGDYIYFRAVMFCLGLCCLRTKLRGRDNELYSRFNGDKGIVIVIDELTGFQGSISKLFSTISSPMVQKALNMGDIDKVITQRTDLENKIRVATMKMNEATKESARMQQEAEIEKLQRQISQLVDEQALYAGTLFSKITESYSLLVTLKNAGFKNKEYNYSDIFVLGQYLDANYYASSLTSSNKGAVSSVFFPLTSKKDEYYAAYKGADIVRSFLEELGELDWFLGRNPDYDYGGKSMNPQAQKVCDIDGNWDYIGRHSCNEVRGLDSANFRHVLFKPYLVLNSHEENDPPTEFGSNPECQYVTQCARRVNETAGGENLWETVRLKHLQPDVKGVANLNNPMYNHLEEGIGFKGLIRETLLTTKEGRQAADSIDEYIVSVLKESGDIANYVAKEMGFDSWQDLIFDLSPKGMFSFTDMINAVTNKRLYTLESRLPLYAKLGVLGSVDAEAESSEGKVLYDFDSAFANLSSEDNASSDVSKEIITPSDDSPSTTASSNRGNFDLMYADSFDTAPESTQEPQKEMDKFSIEDFRLMADIIARGSIPEIERQSGKRIFGTPLYDKCVEIYLANILKEVQR